MDVTPDKSMTSTGTVLLANLSLVPVPSCPDPSPPQHLTRPSAMSAQVWALPAAMRVTPLPSPATPTGTELWLSVPLPRALSPQQLTPPPIDRAHACRKRTAIDATLAPSPATSTGVALEAYWFPPLPSPPHQLEPQHLAVLVAVTAHVKS